MSSLIPALTLHLNTSSKHMFRVTFSIFLRYGKKGAWAEGSATNEGDCLRWDCVILQRAEVTE